MAKTGSIRSASAAIWAGFAKSFTAPSRPKLVRPLMTESDSTCRLYTAAMLAELASVDTWRIRNWQRRGWLRASEQRHRVSYFDFAEIAVARQLAQLLHAGATPKQIQEQLRKLERAVPDSARPMAE